MTIKTSITIRVDRDVLEYFRQQGPGYQTRMNEALRNCMEIEVSAKINTEIKAAEVGLTGSGGGK